MQLTAENQKGLAVHDELGRDTALFKVGSIVLLRRNKGGFEPGEKQDDWKHERWDSHVEWESSTAAWQRIVMARGPCLRVGYCSAVPFRPLIPIA